MPATPKKGRRFGGSSQHQRLMMANLVASLVAAEGIVTTEAKAKALRPVAEKVITKAKKGGLHNHRQVVSYLGDKEMAHKLFTDIGPRYADRNGGYTRILKLGNRQGDNAPMARIELVTEPSLARDARCHDRTLQRPPGPLVRVRLLVAYDGSGFHGFAAQPGQRTVAGVLGEAIEKVVRHRVELTCAGRTDAGCTPGARWSASTCRRRLTSPRCSVRC